MTPTVSVVIPVFNRPAAVCRAVESVLAQTFQDFDVVVVDDGSTDETPSVLAALHDPRLRVIRHDRCRGGSAARNTGIRATAGRYVAFLDSDDEWMPTKLERQVHVFERSGPDVALVYSGVERTHADGRRSVAIPVRVPDLVQTLLIDNVIGETSVGMVRRTAIEAIGGFDESLPASQELDLWLRLCERYAADFVAEPLVRVAKGSDPGRISASIPATTRGRELFRRKHREKLLRHGRLHLHLRESGWWYLRGARDAKKARECCLESLRAEPLAVRTYGLLLATCVPISWLDVIAECVHAFRKAGEARRDVSLDADVRS